MKSITEETFTEMCSLYDDSYKAIQNDINNYKIQFNSVTHKNNKENQEIIEKKKIEELVIMKLKTRQYDTIF